MTFYHGTSSEQAAKGISQTGIKGQVIQGKKQMSPVAGRVYLSHDIAYSLIYAIGANMAGSEMPEQFIGESRYGYVFVVPGTELSDIQPDEDEIGELISDKALPWLNRLAQNHLTQHTYDKIIDGEYAYYASGGKKLLKTMTSAQLIEIMNHAKNVANAGDIMPTQVWRIDKTQTKKLKRDGSNFFKIAERIKMGKIK